MSYSAVAKSEGGTGGRKGHSNMNHWSPTAHIKMAAKKIRRRQSREAIHFDN